MSVPPLERESVGAPTEPRLRAPGERARPLHAHARGPERVVDARRELDEPLTRGGPVPQPPRREAPLALPSRVRRVEPRDLRVELGPLERELGERGLDAAQADHGARRHVAAAPLEVIEVSARVGPLGLARPRQRAPLVGATVQPLELRVRRRAHRVRLDGEPPLGRRELVGRELQRAARGALTRRVRRHGRTSASAARIAARRSSTCAMTSDLTSSLRSSP
ncbi:MAG: hypothetical protein IT385_27125 [Deltaproteobacteria bacterium]|nr:hypothetical protein [Deltaproteobacteria bacterium]